MSFWNFARDPLFGSEWNQDPFFSTGFFDPFRELRRLDREVNRLTRNFARLQQLPLLDQQQGQQQQQLQEGQQQQGQQQLQQAPQQQQQQLSIWTPRLDIKETDKNVELCAELPGVKKEDLKIELENGLLKISGEKREEKREENERFSQMERSFGYFARYFNVGEKVKEGDIQANFENGVLSVKFPKPEETRDQAQRKAIPISEGLRQVKGAEGKEEETKEEQPAVASKGEKEEETKEEQPAVASKGEKEEETKEEQPTAASKGEKEETKGEVETPGVKGEESLKTGEEIKGGDKLEGKEQEDLKSTTEGTVLGEKKEEENKPEETREEGGRKEETLEKGEGIERQQEKLTPAQ